MCMCGTRTEFRASHMLSKQPTKELNVSLSPSFLFGTSYRACLSLFNTTVQQALTMQYSCLSFMSS